MMNQHEEKRRCMRIKTHVPLKFSKLSDSPGTEGEGSVTRNLSEGGICFRTSEFVPLAQRLILAVSIPEIMESIRAISRVAWIKKIETGNEYEVGVQFLEMNKRDKGAISEFMKEKG
jgi:c-di-GMP-binding flagellar brake protein YcgR